MQDLRDRIDSEQREGELHGVVTQMAKLLEMPDVPELRINMFRHIRHGSWNNGENCKWISVPIHHLEHSRAFAYYCIAHLLVHFKVKCNCRAYGLNAWRSAVHSEKFHDAESELLKHFRIVMVYRAENHQCEIQDIYGTHICDGLGQ